MRLLTLGDSLTQGVGDPTPGRAGFSGQLDGWVTHLSQALQDSGRTVAVTNLAVSGAQASHVVSTQLPQALLTVADVATIIIGVNDLCRPGFDIAAFAQNYGAALVALTAVSPVVLSATIHEFDEPFPVPSGLRQKLHTNTEAANEVIRTICAQRKVLVVDMANSNQMGPNVRSVDLLHPNRYGHQLIAAEVLTVLHAAGHFCDASMTPPQPMRRGVSDLAHVAWVGTYMQRVVAGRIRQSHS